MVILRRRWPIVGMILVFGLLAACQPLGRAPSSPNPQGASPPPTQGPPYGPRLTGEPAVGVNVHACWSTMTPATLSAIYSRLAAAGAKWVRIDLGWINFEPSGPGQLDSSYLQTVDNAVNQARADGLQVLADVWSTPSWANGGQANTVPPNNPSDYANMMSLVASHFAGRVSAWEVWNEPNLTAFWSTADPVFYAALVKAAYPAIKAADPNTLVVAATTSENDTAFISAMYANGVHGSFDVLSTHPYQGPANLPPETPDNGTQYVLAHVAAVHALMATNGDANKPIWFTEFGWSSHANTSGTPGWQLGVTDAQQGDFYVRTLRWIATNAPYVTNTFWYEATDDSTTDIQNGNYGLLTNGLGPKQSYSTVSSYLNQ